MLRRARSDQYLPTRGEQGRLAAFAMVGVFGALIGFLVAMHLSQGAVLEQGFAAYDVWMVFAGALGSMAGLYLAGQKFGQPGAKGMAMAVVASVWVSFMGSLVGGSLMLPLYGTMFGPFTLAMTLAAKPLFAVLWFANLFGAHLLLTYWQRERDSIFEAFESGRVDAFRNGTDRP